MFKIGKNFLFFVCVVLFLFAVSCGGSSSSSSGGAKSLHLIGAHVQIEDHSTHAGMVAFKEYVEKESNGAITMEIHHSGQLGANEDELVQKMATGTVDVVITAPAFLMQSVKEVDLFCLPYIFADLEHWYRVMDGKPGKDMADLIEQKSDFKFVSYFKDGIRNTYTVKPINSIDDYKGIKFRIQNTPTQQAFWRAIGTQTAPVAYSEIYQALQNGVIDGAENSIPSVAQQKHYERAKYITLTGHDVATRIMIMAKDKYNMLSDDLKKIVDDAGVYAAQVQREADVESEKKYIVFFEAAGVTISSIDTTPLIERTESIRLESAKNLGLTDMFDEINALR